MLGHGSSAIQFQWRPCQLRPSVSDTKDNSRDCIGKEQHETQLNSVRGSEAGLLAATDPNAEANLCRSVTSESATPVLAQLTTSVLSTVRAVASHDM